jgi:site-specific DNA-adenine methylase
MIKTGISQIGGKFRLRKTLLEYTPNHEFFLSLFCGSAVYEVNKPRCRYECFNDYDSGLINYLLQIREYPKEFNELKEGVFGLVSQEVCNRIVSGKIQPKNDIEKAYFFYYLNKLTFGGQIWQVREKPPYKGIDPTDQAGKFDKAQFRGITLPTVCKDKSINEAKANFRGIAPKSGYKGINPKTTRPYTNNDCGLLSPIEPEAIERLRYVNLTAYSYEKVYKMFHRAFHERKGLEKECFLYADPPYPGTEHYYNSGFGIEQHETLITIIKETPFNIMLSIGGECDLYLEELSDLTIVPVSVKYSTSANHQKESQEYIIMNYDIEKEAIMKHSSEQNIMAKWL